MSPSNHAFRAGWGDQVVARIRPKAAPGEAHGLQLGRPHPGRPRVYRTPGALRLTRRRWLTKLLVKSSSDVEFAFYEAFSNFPDYWHVCGEAMHVGYVIWVDQRGGVSVCYCAPPGFVEVRGNVRIFLAYR